jgi:hypothetical protein
LQTTRAAAYRAVRTESFLEGILYDINLPRVGSNDDPNSDYSDASCQWDFNNQYASQNPGANHNADLGLYLDIGSICSWFGFDVCRIILNFILNIVVALIINDIMCQLFNQLFFLSEGPDNAPYVSKNPGLINVGVRTVYGFMKKYVETPLSTQEDAELAEDVTFPQLFETDGYVWANAGCELSGYCPHPDAIDFNASAIFTAVSLGINGILGNLSTTAGYEDKLVIVEVIDILTGSTDGTVPIGICPPYVFVFVCLVRRIR